jgi:hypothetical protein
MVIHRVWWPGISDVNNLIPILCFSSCQRDGITTLEVIDATTERYQQQESSERLEPGPNL